MKYLAILAAFFVIPCAAPPALADPVVSGEWVTADGEALLQLVDEEHSLIVELRAVANALLPSDDTPRDVDRNNPDPALRDRSLSGLSLGSLAPESSYATWRGRLYDPSRGKTYRVEVRLMTDDVLRVRAYVGLRAFGRTMLWVRRVHYETRLAGLFGAGEAS